MSRPGSNLAALTAVSLCLPAVVRAQTRRAPAAVEPPGLARFDAADYPFTALLLGAEADVPCQLLLDDAGEVISAECRGTDPVFVAKAQDALLKARFSEARKGSAARSFTFVYRFALSVDRLPPPPVLRAPAQLRGLLLIAGEREPVAGAELVAQGVGIGTVTDAHGRFSLRLPAGSQVIVASAPNLFAGQQRLELTANGQAEQTFYLRRHNVGELSATVQAEKARLAPVKTTLVRAELRNVPGSDGDPVRVLESLPGLARVPYAGGQLIVRGSNPEDTGAYLDGQRIPVLYHLLQGPSVLGEEMVDKIDFYPGGAGVYFGRNLAGAVAITSRRGDPERFHGSAAIDLQKAALFLEGPIGPESADTQFAASVRRSYINPIISAFADPRKELTLPSYWDYQSRIDHRLDARDKLTLTLSGSDDSFSLIGGGRGSVPLELGQTVSFHRARIAFERQVSDRLSLVVAPVFGVDTASRNSAGTGAGIFAQPQNSMDHTLSAGLRADLHLTVAGAGTGDSATDGSIELRAGTDILFDRVRYDLNQLFDQQLNSVGAPNAERSHISGVAIFGSFGEYLEGEFRLGRLSLVPGLRVEELHYARHGYVELDPRLWARYTLDSSTTLHAYAGIYHQAPVAEQVDASVGNPSLAPMRAEQLGVGAEHHFQESLLVRVEGFFNVREQLIFAALPVANPNGTFFNPLLLNSGQGRSFGLELFVRRELTSTLYGWISYTLSRSRELHGDGTPWQPTLYDQPQVLTLLLGLRPSPYVEFAVRMRVASGNPIAPAGGASFDADSGSWVAQQGAFGSARLPTFWQLDFEVNNIWVENKYLLQLYLDFQNVLNRLNPELLVYDYRYQQQAYVHGLPFSAVVGAKVSF